MPFNDFIGFSRIPETGAAPTLMQKLAKALGRLPDQLFTPGYMQETDSAAADMSRKANARMTGGMVDPAVRDRDIERAMAMLIAGRKE